MTTPPSPAARDARPREPDVLAPMLLITAAITGLGALYQITGSLAVTAIAATLAGVLGTVPQARRVYHYRVRHWD